MSLRGKIAIVTGASRRQGIGAEICLSLASEGVDVLFTHWREFDRQTLYGPDEDGPAVIEQALRDVGVRVASLEVDLSRENTPVYVFDTAMNMLGEPHILVNNAAFDAPGKRGIDTLNAAELDMSYAVNVRGMALLSAEFVRHYPGGPGGRIINLTSGQSVGPMPDSLAYATSKGAVEAFTSSLAPAVAARGITVNAVDPGATDTGWMMDEQKMEWSGVMGMGRVGLPEDAARLVTFLASEESGWITGQVIHSRGA